MRTYQIVADSATDFTMAQAEALHVKLVPFSVTFDSSTVYTEHKDLTTDEFYEKVIHEAAFPKTSQPTIQHYLDVFEPIIKAGNDILCVCLTSGVSGSYQSAFNAKNMLEEAHPEAKICVVDTLQATGSEHLVAHQAIAMRDAGVPLVEAAEKLENIAHNHCKLFFSMDNLDHMVKGGRIGKAAGLASNILNIKAILTLVDGVVHPAAKVRSTKKVFAFMKNDLDTVVGGNKSDYQVQVIYTSSQKLDAAKQFMQELVDDGYEVAGDAPVQLGLCMGSHGGPLLVGLAYCKKYTAL
ncbi:DegV family protein [Chakrabartyella piscis]|uniref:DegV family protein n=1 Tax=Chakrabartyella piscis TaxID=2918914 RepID=UPI00295844DC|nr:DegV family protein [Chakrabartyella piscis]